MEDYEKAFKSFIKEETKAQQLGITKFPYIEKDENGNEIYFEDLFGDWEKQKFDSNNNRIYCETSDGYWSKYEYDSNDNLIYYKNSDGYIEDNRPKKK